MTNDGSVSKSKSKAKANQNVLTDEAALRDITLGELHQIAQGRKFRKQEALTAKRVLAQRVEKEARAAGIYLGKRYGPCNELHGTYAGVGPDTAGAIFEYVSSSVSKPFNHPECAYSASAKFARMTSPYTP